MGAGERIVANSPSGRFVQKIVQSGLYTHVDDRGLGIMATDTITCKAVLADGIGVVRLAIKAGVIASLVEAEETAATLPGLLFPGFADIHVHAREYPRPSDADTQALTRWEAACRKETFATAGRAAINGGATLFAAMPNDDLPPDTPEAYSRKTVVASASDCPVILYAAVTASSEPWADLPYKVYLDDRPSACAFASWTDLETALTRYRGCRVFFHAEDPLVLNRAASDGPRWRTRPPEAEISAVARILDLTHHLGLKSHICHVSTRQAVTLIDEYNRTASARVTCEATPHHLFFSVDKGKVFSGTGAAPERPDLLECNPPLRPESDRRFLLDALKSGMVDVLASDHAPHTLTDKDNGAPGMPHLDTLGPFAGWLMQECGFLPTRIVSVLSSAPARIMQADLGIPHGAIEPGFAASFTLLGLDGSTLVHGSRIPGRGTLETRCGWSPFSGIALPAVVRGTIIDGKKYSFLGVVVK